MKIQTVEIKGLFGKKDVIWELNPQVNVLVGENGSGKSTILSILYDLLSNEEQKGKQLLRLVNSFTIIDYNKESITATTSSSSQFNNELQVVLSDIKQKYDMDIDIKLNNPFDYLIKHSENIHNFTGNLYIDIIEANLTNSNANHIIQKSNQEKTNALDMEIRETIYELQSIQSNEVIERLLIGLNAFFNEVGKQVSYENNELTYTDIELKKTLNYSQLSSGERQLIYILLRVALSNKDKSKTAIILMDEPEISLHVNWQSNFIKQLTLLNPDAQFIIVTHSPAIIMNGWNDVYKNMDEITQ